VISGVLIPINLTFSSWPFILTCRVSPSVTEVIAADITFTVSLAAGVFCYLALSLTAGTAC
jgi:hypothetical protein